MRKRLLSLFLAMAMVVSTLPTSALAEEVESGQETVPTVTETVLEEPAPDPEPATEPETVPVTEPVTEPETEAPTESETEPVTEPETEPATEPAIEPEQTELVIEGVHEGYVGDLFQLNARYGDGTVPETVTWESSDKSVVAVEMRENGTYAVLLAPGTAEITAKDAGGLMGRFAVTVLESATEAPTEEATEAPTEEATEVPTEVPTEEATELPTEAPVDETTEVPAEEGTSAADTTTNDLREIQVDFSESLNLQPNETVSYSFTPEEYGRYVFYEGISENRVFFTFEAKENGQSIKSGSSRVEFDAKAGHTYELVVSNNYPFTDTIHPTLKKAVAPTKISLSMDSISAFVGDQKILTVTVEPRNATWGELTCSSDNEDIVSCGTGLSREILFSCRTTGTAVITAKMGDCTAFCTVSVSAGTPISVGDVVEIEAGKRYVFAFTAPETDDYCLVADENVSVSISYSGIVSSGMRNGQSILCVGIPGGETGIFNVQLNGQGNAKVRMDRCVPVESINLHCPEQMSEGDTLYASYTYAPRNSFLKNLKWSSSNPSVVQVGDNQLNPSVQIIAVAAGDADITVSVDGLTASQTIRVIAPTQLTLGQPVALGREIEQVHTFSFTAPKDGDYCFLLDENVLASISSWGGSFNSVSQRGSVLYVNMDVRQTVTFKVRRNGSGDVKVWMDRCIPVESIELQNCVEQLLVGETTSPSVTYAPRNSILGEVTWSSSNSEVLQHDGNGKFTAVAAGEADVIATTANGVSASHTVRVIEPTTINVGFEQQLTDEDSTSAYYFNFTAPESRTYVIFEKKLNYLSVSVEIHGKVGNVPQRKGDYSVLFDAQAGETYQIKLSPQWPYTGTVCLKDVEQVGLEWPLAVDGTYTNHYFSFTAPESQKYIIHEKDSGSISGSIRVINETGTRQDAYSHPGVFQAEAGKKYFIEISLSGGLHTICIDEVTALTGLSVKYSSGTTGFAGTTGSFYLQLSPIPINATIGNVTYSIANPEIAELTAGEYGGQMLRLLKAGTTELIATEESGVSVSVPITVKEPRVIHPGESAAFTVASTRPFAVQYTAETAGDYCFWTRSDEVLNVSFYKNFEQLNIYYLGLNNRLYLNAGDSIVLLFKTGIDNYSDVLFFDKCVEPTGITLDRTSIDATVGSTYYLNVDLQPTNAQRDIIWESSNPEVAEVRGDMLTDRRVVAKKAGSAVITATVGGVSASCVVTVSDLEEIQPGFSREVEIHDEVRFRFVATETAKYRFWVEGSASNITIDTILEENYTPGGSSYRSPGNPFNTEEGTAYIISVRNYTLAGPVKATLHLDECVPLQSLELITNSDAFVVGSPVLVRVIPHPGNADEIKTLTAEIDGDCIELQSKDISTSSSSTQIGVAIKPGTATLTVTSDSGISASIPLIVRENETITVGNVREVTLQPGAQLRYDFSVEQEGCYIFHDIADTWSPLQFSIYYVYYSYRVGAGQGRAEYIAQPGQKLALVVENPTDSPITTRIALEGEAALSSILLTEKEISCEPGSTLTIRANTEPGSAPMSNLLWSVDDSSVTRITGEQAGNVTLTCEKAGTAVLTATIGDVTASCIIHVTSQQEPIASGTCGENLTWTLSEDGTLTISGTGNMADYSYSSGSEAPWYPYGNQIVSASIEPGVTSIGSFAFNGCSDLISVTIQQGVSSIGQCAFQGCSNLTSMSIPQGVTAIASHAFSGCSSLTSVTIPQGVATIGSYAFSECSSLTSVTIPESVTTIGERAFYGCSSLASVTIPNSVSSISDGTFSECSSLASVTIPESVATIGKYAFDGCSNLTSVTIPNSVFSIGNSAFCGCRSLTSVTIPESVTTIDYGTFWWCSSLSNVTIPDSVTTIGAMAFAMCGNLASVIIPNGVTTIDVSAFSGCSSLANVTIPESVTTIGSYAFRKCSSLTSVTIPDSVTAIGKWTFDSCSSLTSVFIPDSVTNIDYGAFWGCSSLTVVYFGGATEEKWNQISIADGNDPLLNATIHYNATHICTLIEVPAKTPTSTEDGNYQYWICSICGKAYKDALGKVETTVDAETIRVKPAATTLTKAAGGEGSFTATWNAQQNVDGYALQYATNSSFTSCKTVMVYGGDITTTTVNGLAAGSYYVRVRTFKIVGSSKTYSLASTPLTVTVASTKPVGTMLTKVIGGEGSFTAVWNVQTNVDGYAVQYATNSSFVSCATLMVYGGSTTATTVKDLPAGTYYVRVRTFKTEGGSKAYSLASAFLTVTVSTVRPATTTLTKVTGDEGSFTATWNAQEDVDGYAVQYATNSNFVSCRTLMVYGGSSTSTTVNSLSAGTYYVRIRTFRITGSSKIYSLASGSLTVTVASTKPAATMLTKVTGGEGSFTAAWNVQANVEGYALQYSTSSSFTSYKTLIVSDASTVSISVNDLPAGTYYVRVRTFKTVDGSKTYSLPSSTMGVTVSAVKPTATTLAKVTGGEGCFTASWDAQRGVDGYAVQYATNSSFISCKTVMVYGGSVTATTVNSLNAGTYYVRIRTFKIAGSSKIYSLASTALTVTVASTKPAATMLTKVTGGEGSFTALWSAQTNVEGYVVQYSTNSRFTSYKTLMVEDAGTLSITVKDLPAGTYYVRVRTFKTVSGSKTYSLPSGVLTVTVASVKPAATTLAKVTGDEGSFTASWDAQKNVDGYAMQYSTDSSFTFCKTLMVYGENITSATVKGLSAGTYYVRIRTFETVDGAKSYSLASVALKVTVK